MTSFLGSFESSQLYRSVLPVQERGVHFPMVCLVSAKISSRQFPLPASAPSLAPSYRASCPSLVFPLHRYPSSMQEPIIPPPAAPAASVPPAQPGQPVSRFDRYARPPLLEPEQISRKYPHRYLGVHEPAPEDFIGHSARYELRTSFYLIRAFLSILDWTAFLVIFISIGFTALCIQFGLYTDMPLSLLASGIVFPISFQISYAASRRERMLLDIASLKASMMGLYYLHRDWASSFNKPKHPYANNFRALMRTFVQDLVKYMEHKGGKERLHRIYETFDAMSKIHEALRKEEDWVKVWLPCVVPSSFSPSRCCRARINTSAI